MMKTARLEEDKRRYEKKKERFDEKNTAQSQGKRKKRMNVKGIIIILV